MRYLPVQLLLLVLLLNSCALQMPPEGGAKDVTPPKILSTIPENKSTNFTGRDIRINFDELISITELSNQLIISPLLKYPPEIKMKKRSLLIHLKDTLRENTTYTLNFGSGIADNNEGNKLEDYQMVFSTGPVLDSLSVTGKVTRANDLSTEKGILVSLYTAFSDSTPYLEKPVYFTRTNDSGSFRITNIAPGSYHIIALKDADANYLFTPGEAFAFRNEAVEAGDTGITLRMFDEIPEIRLLKSLSVLPGKAALVFNGPADSVRINWISDSTTLGVFNRSFSDKHDTLFIWYKNVYADTMSMSFLNPGVNDTVVMRLFRKTDEKQGRSANSTELKILPAKTQTTTQHLHLPYRLEASRPLSDADFSKIELREDSQFVTGAFSFADSLHTQLELKYPWKSRKKYSVFIPPGTFTDVYGTKNDSAIFSFNAHAESDYGSVTAKLWLSSSGPFIVQLVGLNDINVIRQSVVTRDTTIEMLNLDAGQYRIKIIHDKNANGKWDTGNYLQKVQPEIVEFYKEPIVVRGNWDVELQMEVPMKD